MTTTDIPGNRRSETRGIRRTGGGRHGRSHLGLLLHIGDRLGLYKAIAGAGPITSSTLAQRTGTTERYVREWLGNRAAGGYVV